MPLFTLLLRVLRVYPKEAQGLESQGIKKLADTLWEKDWTEGQRQD